MLAEHRVQNRRVGGGIERVPVPVAQVRLRVIVPRGRGRVCSESAKFNAAFVRIGLSGCDVGVSYLLPRIVGPTVAFEMMLTGRLIDASLTPTAVGSLLGFVPSCPLG